MLLIGGVLTAGALIAGFFPISAGGVACGSFLSGGVNFVLVHDCGQAKEVWSLFVFFLFLVPGVGLLMSVGLHAVKARRQRRAVG